MIETIPPSKAEIDRRFRKALDKLRRDIKHHETTIQSMATTLKSVTKTISGLLEHMRAKDA